MEKVMLKHLLYYDWHLDIRAGGPPGYLANLRYGLDRIDNPEKFEIELWAIKKQSENNNSSKWANLVNNNRILKYLSANYFSKAKKSWFKSYVWFLENIDNQFIQDEVIKKIKSENIKMVHCNYVIDALKVINTLKREGIKDVKVLLTSHMPEAPSSENYSLILEMGYSKKKATKFRKLWEHIEKRAFCESDILIFPSKEAMEPYFETLANFGEWTKNKDIRFFQTGAKALETNKTKEELKKQFRVPEDKKVVVYIGRHNEVKGYDVLTAAGKNILSERKDVLFLIGGKQNCAIQPPKNKNWRELGWINPAELLKIADVFILPNKRTYFDLILLEVMSTGTPVIATNTGGNKSVQEVINSLILYDGTSKDLENKLNKFLNKPKEEKLEISNKMLEAYKNNYTPEHFAQRYIDLVEEIYKDYEVL